ncbi:BlaI/MecI/CopY family transcriptional regulator [Flavobacteriaceae bacterium TP-CH-4]|uniref:BlaI/MecI/CopY family transcriptional regulator n=1 Tax=Pelagihabitans pacificus TaxID=2696054 RepID=A0A967AZV1_9FLAO|nr:BlaI/MecI/CopY family transcriptional regulator [Pelagihabitans pacificus]NHF59546.1 BlaI/MecI/CopY family transcriptional regulator [Pelagihabitans pacificus]
MQKLTKREDQIMQLIWQSDGMFIRDIVERLPHPKPHYNTVATIVKILVKKGFLTSEKLGNVDRYNAVVSMEAYRKEDISNIKKKYFDNSFSKMMAHFAKQEQLTDEEIQELIAIIKSKKV